MRTASRSSPLHQSLPGGLGGGGGGGGGGKLGVPFSGSLFKFKGILFFLEYIRVPLFWGKKPVKRVSINPS